MGKSRQHEYAPPGMGLEIFIGYSSGAQTGSQEGRTGAFLIIGI